METITLTGRVVRSHGQRLRLRESEGNLSIDAALEAAGMEDGDLVEITVVRRNVPLPLLDLPLQHGRPYGSPIPFPALERRESYGEEAGECREAAEGRALGDNPRPSDRDEVREADPVLVG